MSLRRTLGAAAVVLVATLAIVSVAVPSLIAALAPAWLVPPPDARADAAERVLLPVGLLALVAGTYAAFRLVRARSTPVSLDPSVEGGWSSAVDTVGGRFRQERARAARDWVTAGQARSAAEFRERLTVAAVEAHVLGAGVDRPTAREAVREGTWTDDPVAAWFLAEETADVRVPATTWLRAQLLPVRTYRDVVDRTTAAIDARRGEP